MTTPCSTSTAAKSQHGRDLQQNVPGEASRRSFRKPSARARSDRRPVLEPGRQRLLDLRPAGAEGAARRPEKTASANLRRRAGDADPLPFTCGGVDLGLTFPPRSSWDDLTLQAVP